MISFANEERFAELTFLNRRDCRVEHAATATRATVSDCLVPRTDGGEPIAAGLNDPTEPRKQKRAFFCTRGRFSSRLFVLYAAAPTPPVIGASNTVYIVLAIDSRSLDCGTESIRGNQCYADS